MRARQVLSTLLLGATALAAYGCDDLNPHKQAAAAPPAASAPTTVAAAPAAPAVPIAPAVATTPAATTPMARSIESAQAGAATPATATKVSNAPPSPLLIKVEVLLDRAHFSPGVIDGQPGENLTNALAAYAKAHGTSTAGPDAATLTALTGQDKAAITQTYVITADDEAGPFIGPVAEDFVAESKLKTLGYTDPVQELAAKFHMSQTLLKTLNPGADFTKVGTSLVVIQPGMAPLPTVARLEVDKAANQVRALDSGGKLLAAFPATVGSTERPAPSGEYAVAAVAPNPTYTYDPSRLTFGPKSKGKLTIEPGPNNPVGSTWIALTIPTYGIHGSPDPAKVGKTASHGCVRLTNWDAVALGKAVTKGTPVVFVGQTTKT